MKTWAKRIAVLAVAVAMCLTSVASFAAGKVTWQVKDYITTTGISGTVGDGLGTGQGGPALIPPYEIVYEQYLDGVSTGLVVSGDDAEDYGLKGYASSITRPVSWYDSTYPNYQYEEIFADGQYTGLLWPTGARLPKSAYKDVRFDWEVGGTHKEIAQTKAFLNGAWYSDDSYPVLYTGANANVKEDNMYFGFDVFEVFADGKARDVEVVLDKTGNAVNTTNAVKANYMINAADENEILPDQDGIVGSITGLVNSGSGVDSVLYDMLANDGAYAAQRTGLDNQGNVVEVPVYNYTNFASTHFDNKLPITHYFKLAGPTYNANGDIAQPFGKVINAYDDCVATFDGNGTALLPNGSSDWDFIINRDRYGFYTNNLITTYSYEKAVTDWVYAGYEVAEPYRLYEYLSIEGIVFDGDIDNDGVLDTPVIFRYPTSSYNTLTSGKPAFADPKVEWRYAFAQASYPHEIFAEKYVEDMNGKMVATGDLRGTGKYAKENLVSVINPTNDVPSVHKHYQMRLEWRDNETRRLYVSPYFDVNKHAAEYVELSVSADPSYIDAIDYNPAASASVNLTPSVASAN